MASALPAPDHNDHDASGNGQSRSKPASDHNDHNASGNGPGQSKSNTKNRIPSIEEIVAKLEQLSGLVIMNVISPAKAAIVQRNLRTILDVHHRGVASKSSVLPEEALVELCQRDPRAVELLAPFLTDEQLQRLMAWVTRDSNG